MNSINSHYPAQHRIENPLLSQLAPSVQKKYVAIKYFDLLEDLAARNPASFYRIEPLYIYSDGVKVCNIEAAHEMMERIFEGELVDRQKNALLALRPQFLSALKALEAAKPKLTPAPPLSNLSASEIAAISTWYLKHQPQKSLDETATVSPISKNQQFETTWVVVHQLDRFKEWIEKNPTFCKKVEYICTLEDGAQLSNVETTPEILQWITGRF